MSEGYRLRWLAVIILVLSSALNYLDRQVFVALSPTIRAEFGLDLTQLGYVHAAFSFVYAVSSLFVGWWLDRVGLRRGAAAIVAVWSLAGAATGLAGSFLGLMLFRSLLGFAESGGIPATGKAFASYLLPRDRALGTALNQAGITLGSSSAPLMAEFLLPHFGWRSAFLVAGSLGVLWVHVWLLTSARVAPLQTSASVSGVSIGSMFRDRRFLAIIAANCLAMAVYSLWTLWTTEFLVTRFGLAQGRANLRLAWIPPLFALAGGLAGATAGRTLMARGVPVVKARLTVATFASGLAFTTALAPLAPSPDWATAAIAASFAGVTCLSVHYYALPLDLFPVERAAFAIAALTGTYGMMQAVLAPQIGYWSTRAGWLPICAIISAMPFLSVLLLKGTFRES